MAVADKEPKESAHAGDETRDRPRREPGRHQLAHEGLQLVAGQPIDTLAPSVGETQETRDIARVALNGVVRKTTGHAELVEIRVGEPGAGARAGGATVGHNPQ